MKRILPVFIFLLLALTAAAQRVRCNAPGTVEEGSRFQIEYVIDGSDVSSFELGRIPNGIEIIGGPFQSEVSSYQFVNGHYSGSTTVTISYIAVATKGGNVVIPPAHVVANRKHISSKSVRIHVAGGSQSAPSNGYSGSSSSSKGRTVGKAGGSDLFILVSASKTHVHEQEPVMLTYKVYTTENLTQLNGAMPDLKGFHTQEVKLPQQKTFHSETLKGRTYQTVTWSQYIMYPQMTGKLTIPPITFHGVVMEEDRSENAFFSGGGYKEVKRDVTAPGISIKVDPLPTKPAGFSGGVGHFNISGQLAKKEVRAGDPINLRIVLSGSGNLKLIKEPAVEIPKDFDKYDTKITDKTKLTESGVEGNMVYDYLFVARKKGVYTIPAIKFTYYDTSENRYKTITTQPFTVNVAEGTGNSDVSNFDEKDQDIRPIKTGDAKVHKIDDFFFGSLGYCIVLILLLGVFALLLYNFRKTALMHSDVVGMRRNNAEKIATRRLRRANELMLKGRSSEFYDEVMRALWGYVSDKLSISREHLSSDNIVGKLSALGVDDETITKFTDALHDCEFERYAPGDTQGNMNHTMESAMTAIMRIEDALAAKKQNAGKGNAGHAAMMLLMLLAFALIPLTSSAVTKHDADVEYQKKNYQQAIADYQKLLKGGVSADIYYNLGNAYYRIDNITQALIAYERAYMLSPGDGDIRFNLEMARSKTIDKITPESEMFFVIWYKALVNFMSVDAWAVTAILSLIIAIICVLAYLFKEDKRIRRIGFYGGIAFFVIFILANIFAYNQRYWLLNKKGAIVTASSVNVMNGPSDNSGSRYVIHEGTRVDILDKSIANWRSIRIADGREGWIKAKQLEEI